jgi:hypothetical protein
MNMADHRGSLQGRVRNDAGTAVANAEVMAVNAANGAPTVASTPDPPTAGDNAIEVTVTRSDGSPAR